MKSSIGFLRTLAVSLLFCGVARAVPPCVCPSDLDGDCDTDVFDFGIFAANFGQSVPVGTNGDLDNDGDVDVFDFGLFAANFGCRAPAYAGDPNPNEPGEEEPAVPERMRTCSSSPSARSQISEWVNGVYVFSGEAHQVMVDMRVRGRVMDLVWARKYRSQIGPDTAQGNGWDYSYNIYLEPDGSNLVLHDGFARCDLYSLQPSGNWTAPEFFREIEQLPDTSYLVHFPDTGHWALHPLDGSPSAGKIDRIEDRNGNTISFAYDAGGNLVTVTDDLGRDYTLTYNPAGRIESLTDFTGRQVVYEYYDNGDAGGSAGDLKSARSPIVTGTPNGNDFPFGKTTVYTYSTGSSDELLNHNLLTITDPKGQTYLQYEYAPTTDRTDLLFDRVVRETWGDPGDVIDFHYESVVPGAGNNDSSIVTVLNLRRGNVKELYSDASNRVRMCREYTGFADPDLPTTLVINRPTGQLRAGDPASYERRWDYSPDGRLISILLPSLTETLLSYDDTNPVRTAQGNLIERRLEPGPLGGDQAQLVETFEYEPGFGGCCGTNFMTRHVDFRGNETLHTYDPAGNRLTTTQPIPSIVSTFTYNGFGQLTSITHPDNGSGYHRVDQYSYYIVGPQLGYLGAVTVDVNGDADTTAYEYNDRGAMTRRVDPLGADELFYRNQLDQIVRTESREVTTPNGPIRYQHDVTFDANDNRVQVDVQNIDDQGLLQANTHFTTTYTHDILNSVVSTSEEIDAGAAIVTNTLRDEHRNVRFTEHGEATNGNDPLDTVTVQHDERELTYRRTRAAGSADQTTDEFAYSGNKVMVERAGGIEGTAQIRTWEPDGYNRVVNETDPMGNVTHSTFDPNGNLVSRELFGELVDVPGDAGNQLLESTTWEYDDLNRKTREDRAFFDPVTSLPIDDSLTTTQWTWTDRSQIQSTTNDNSHAMTYLYDTKLRQASITDAAGNARDMQYDKNDNILTLTETDHSSSGAPDQVFTTTYAWDEDERLIAETDNIGNMVTRVYDSRDNLTSETDARGNVTRHVYDGAKRHTATERDLTDDGTGGGLVIGSVVTTTAYDDDGRVSARADDNGNTTLYSYDSPGRLDQITYADGTIWTATYDVHDNRIGTIDQAATIRTYTYDLDDRRTRMDIIFPGGGVSTDTTFQQYAYDGRGLIVEALDDDSALDIAYDSLGREWSETLNGKTTTSERDGVGNVVTSIYPGGRTLTRTFDELERVQSVNDLLIVVLSYESVGGRIESRAYGDGTIAEFTYDGVTGVANSPGDSGVKQISRTLHRNTATMQVFEDRRYRWDPDQNKLSRRDARAGGGPRYRHEYELDSVSRLTGTQIFDAANSLVRDTAYTLDGVHNRTGVAGGLAPGAYTMDATTPNPADFQVNQYTQTSFDSRLYDQKGNLGVVDFGLPSQVLYEYDCDNLLTRIVDSQAGQEHAYKYDALGRRIARVVDASGVSPIETRYFYCGSQVCEEQDPLGSTLATYVYGRGIDEVVTMRRAGADYYFHDDDMGNVMALTDASGTLVERYEYDDFGRPLMPSTLNPVAANPSAMGNPFLFTGRRFDSESHLYWYRSRYMDPAAGRFTSRDTGGAQLRGQPGFFLTGSVWNDPMSFGNGSTYAASNPWTLVDDAGTTAGRPSGPTTLEADEEAIAFVRVGHGKKTAFGKERRAQFQYRYFNNSESDPFTKLVGKWMKKSFLCELNVLESSIACGSFTDEVRTTYGGLAAAEWASCCSFYSLGLQSACRLTGGQVGGIINKETITDVCETDILGGTDINKNGKYEDEGNKYDIKSAHDESPYDPV